MNTTTMTAANAGGDPENLFLPEVGTTCIAVPHGTDWGFNSLDPAGVEIKGYDDDYVWMLANRTHYVTTLVNRVTFHPVQTKPATAKLTLDELLSGGWYTQDCEYGDAYVLKALGVPFLEDPDMWGEVTWTAIQMHAGWPVAARCSLEAQKEHWERSSNPPREIYRKGVHFYYY